MTLAVGGTLNTNTTTTIQLINPQIHLARILQYASTLGMAPLPCNSQLQILPINIMIILVNDMTSEKFKPYGKISKLVISSK